MSEPVAFPGSNQTLAAWLGRMAATPDLEAIVVVARVNGAWFTTWRGASTAPGSDGRLTGGSLSMATLKLLHDVQHLNEGQAIQSPLPPDDAA